MNSIKTALERLHDALKRLKPDQGRIARRNARRTALGALQSVRNALDKDFPAISKPRKARRPKVLHWREYEKQMHFPDECKPGQIDAFHSFFALQDGINTVPVKFYERDTRRLGVHYYGKQIRVKRGMTPQETWATILHELAHYRVHHHRAAFTVELMRIYKLFKNWWNGGTEVRSLVSMVDISDGRLEEKGSE
jgi:hypothetical protein